MNRLISDTRISDNANAREGGWSSAFISFPHFSLLSQPRCDKRSVSTKTAPHHPRFYFFFLALCTSSKSCETVDSFANVIFFPPRWEFHAMENLFHGSSGILDPLRVTSQISWIYSKFFLKERLRSKNFSWNSKNRNARRYKFIY